MPPLETGLRAPPGASATAWVPLVVLALAVVVAGLQSTRWVPAPPASLDEGSLGETVFLRRCAVCHPTDGRSAQGPNLAGVVGRKAASAPGFGYTTALRQSGLTWDAPTLERFLISPSDLVPGTTMPMTVPVPEERRDLIRFLSTIGPSGGRSPEPNASSSPGDYHGDAPGVRRRVQLARLPPPFATPSAANGPSVVSPPPGATPRVPPGFRVDTFAAGLDGPRLVRVAPNGDVFVAETARGRIRVLRAREGAAQAERVEVFASDLERPFGMAFYPPGDDPRWLYVANNNSIVRFPYQRGDLHAQAPARTVIPLLSENTGGHSTRDIAFSRDGARMFVSVGSESNVAEGMSSRYPDDIAAWEASHGLGASWDFEENRADVLMFDPQGGPAKPFANGIRNCVGLLLDPPGRDLWCATNERDGLGDDLVPDYVTRVREGAFYGWPWFYLGDHEDPRHAGERPDLAKRVSLPDVLLQSHSAPLGMAFYEGTMFPTAYHGDLFVALHGSWNRASRTGPKVVRVMLDHGAPTGEYEDFLTGLVVDAANVWARPVGVGVALDGALLVSEDANGTLWRIRYERAPSK